MFIMCCFFSSRRRHTRCALVTGVQTCALPIFDQSIGDPTHTPNPCLGPIRTAPFYAVKINPGDATTTLGLLVDARARVLDAKGKVLAGLYACGLVMNSLLRGVPPAYGAHTTPSLTFGYLAEIRRASCWATLCLLWYLSFFTVYFKKTIIIY